MEKKFILKIKYKTKVGFSWTINCTTFNQYPTREEVDNEVSLFIESNNKQSCDIIDVHLKEQFEGELKQNKEFSDTFIGKVFIVIGEIFL